MGSLGGAMSAQHAERRVLVGIHPEAQIGLRAMQQPAPAHWADVFDGRAPMRLACRWADRVREGAYRRMGAR